MDAFLDNQKLGKFFIGFFYLTVLATLSLLMLSSLALVAWVMFSIVFSLQQPMNASGVDLFVLWAVSVVVCLLSGLGLIHFARYLRDNKDA